jgi:hypothetical protein
MARNTNRQGANFELDVMHYLAGTLPEKWGPGFGYDCLRSSGSKGKVDVVAIAPPWWGPMNAYDTSNLLFIQCKITAKPLRSPLSPAERLNLMGLALRGGALPLTASRQLDPLTGRVRPHFRLLTGPGARDWVPWNPGKDN